MKGNTVSIKGTVVKDAETRSTATGRIVAQFPIVWNTSRPTEGGSYEEVPHYFDCKVWLTERQASYLTDKLTKGAFIAITDGHIVQEKWKTPSGENRSKVVIQIDDPIGGLLAVPREPSSPYTAGDGYEDDSSYSVYDEDIPF